jgi:pilus assembly protein CpaB
VGPTSEADPSASANLSASELLTTVGLQSVSGSTASPIGTAFLDPAYGSPFYAVPSEDQRPRLVSQAMIQDAMVLQMGTFENEAVIVPTPEPAVEGQPVEETAAVTTPTVPDVITLVVTPQDAVTLNYLMFAGAKLTLAARPANDDTRVETEAVTLQFLLDQYNIAVPAKLPYGLEPRIDSAEYPVLTNDIVPTPVPER